MLEGRPLSADEVRRLADLESREVLLAKLAGAMKASLTRAAYLFVAPLSQAVRTIDALRLKQEEGATHAASAAEPAGEEPAGEEPAAQEPAAQESAAAATPEPTEG